MADSVNLILEKMVPDLELLEKQGSFSREEIRQMVKRRTAFEYGLRRTAKVVDDYLR